jgi:hypothetical protein
VTQSLLAYFRSLVLRKKLVHTALNFLKWSDLAVLCKSPDGAAHLRQQRRHPGLRRRRIPVADRMRHLLVGVERMRTRRPRHQPLVRATAEDLRDHLAEGAEHVVAAGLEDQVVELDVGGEEVDEGAGLAEAAEIHRELGDARALGSRRMAGRE